MQFKQKMIGGLLAVLLACSPALAMTVEREGFSITLPDTAKIDETEQSNLLSFKIDNVTAVISSTEDKTMLKQQMNSMKRLFRANAAAKETGESDIADLFHGHGITLTGKIGRRRILTEMGTFAFNGKGYLVSFTYPATQKTAATKIIHHIMHQLELN